MRAWFWAAMAVVTVCDAAPAQSLVKGVPPEQIGYLLGSIGMIKAEDDRTSVALSLCDDKNHEIATFQYRPSLAAGRRNSFTDGDFTGVVLSVALPAGRYSLCETMLKHAGRPYGPAEKFSIPIEIVAGKANYIGRYGFRGLMSENFLGHKNPDKGLWVVAQKWTEDGPAFIEQAPHAASLPPTLAMPQQLPAPLFVLGQ
jgi:hypothetical protein